MMNKPKHYSHFIFAAIFIAELVAVFFHYKTLEFWIKPTIMLSILWFFIQYSNPKHPIFYWSVAAFGFSLIGDVLLLFSSNNELFFLTGIAAFLLSHLFYIVTFSLKNSLQKSFLIQKPIYFILILLIGTTLYLLLYPHLEGILKIAVLLYSLAITGMLLMAVNRKNGVTAQSFSLVVWGAVLFLISDSLLAINRFWFEIPQSGILIMATYMLAQYLILQGLIVQTTKQ